LGNLRMEKANEQRAEQRLSYRWPVHFTQDDKERAFPGQIVDVSSRGIAFLCHADKNCPYPGQLLRTNFGIPHFDQSNSFDTVLFNRIGRVYRSDELSSQIRRVVIQFTEPLFFKPGEQGISESDAQKRLEDKALSIIKAEEKAKVYDEALTRAEERIRSYAEAKAKSEEKLKAEIEERYRTEADLKLEVQKKLSAYAEATTKAKERAKTEAQARAKAEEKAKSEAKLRAKAEKKAKAEEEKRTKIKDESQKKTKFYAEEITKIKEEKAQAIAQIKAEAANTIAKIEEEAKVKGNSIIKSKDKQPIKEVVLKKVDKFVTDRNKIF